MTSNHEPSRLPLRALQVFEAAARRKSFTEAGNDLGITQSAVSRKVAELEAILDVQLFLRSGPRITLTDAGSKLSDRVAYALNDLSRAMTHARPTSGTSIVKLSMLPSVAAKWLAPKLAEFTKEFPSIELSISASRNLTDFENEGIDGAIRYGLGDWPGLEVIWLRGEEVLPVCSPDFLAKNTLRSPIDLLEAPLLHADIAENWAVWFAACGITNAKVPRGPRLGDDTAILQAALAGQGVALGRALLVADDLKAGRLVAPFNVRVETSYSYWFVSLKNSSEALAIVRGWLARRFGLL